MTKESERDAFHGAVPAGAALRSSPAPLAGPLVRALWPVRGVTVGPIESALHPNKGYGTAACARSMADLGRWGANWVSLTPFGRVYDLRPSEIDLDFEVSFEKNRVDVSRAIEQAHRAGLRVMLVPHLWVEDGAWRAEIDPRSEVNWERWERAYAGFVLAWARVAQAARVDLFSVGVELRSWVTTTHAASFHDLVEQVREVYTGPLTYAANWDDVDTTTILGELDVIGINAFYPLTQQENASAEELLLGARKLSEQVSRISRDWNKPVLFTEIGYTTRPDPALRPWEWPDRMTHVRIDESAQARAYRALIASFIDEPWFLGFFVWRVYADPDDTSQEAAWGFSPRGKLAELVVRDALSTLWIPVNARASGQLAQNERAQLIGNY